MSTPIFDQLAAELGVLCPICGTAEVLRGLLGADDRGGDLDVCSECWMRGYHWPQTRAERACADCGKFRFGSDAYVIVVGDGVLPVCADHYWQRVCE